jgi:Reverse transcriptase (RNA-dependent DNA polymerase)/RNase H-like domain found in reverse transcriptase
MEMAGYSKLSATANLISINRDYVREIKRHNIVGKNAEYNNCHKTSLNESICIMKPAITIPLTRFVFNVTTGEVNNKLVESEKKIYIPTYINNYRIIGCVDSGSDLTIMHSSLYHKIKRKNSKLDRSEINYITTFSDTNITIEGKFGCKLRLKNPHKGIDIDIYIIPDIPNQTPFLLGNDLLKTGLGQIGYIGSPQNTYPEITFKYPQDISCAVYYAAPRELNICEATCTLDPYETQEVEFKLHPAAPVIRKDIILITSICWDTVSIVPSRTALEYVHNLQSYTAMGQVINLSNQRLTVQVRGKFELINTYRAIEISEMNKGYLATAIKTYPLSREVLNVGDTAKIGIAIPCVNQITSHHSNVQVSDLEIDSADTVMSKEPTYSGEGEISEEVFEPHGIDLPTVIYRNAQEAVDLTKYNQEIGNHLKRIFLEKHPKAVALHAMDSGDFSLTLGYIKLRLREGETLPRAKRIFHISPSDTRHLDDICEFLIKFGYIRRAKPDPNGTHLYGLSSYLVPRAKPGTLGRLVVDFSPINPLIEQPSSVIPEITATLQSLQGKAMFTSLDLRYAFMGLKIDEESTALTTFLTPSGSYQWLSLPTGSANSPAYFTTSMNKILHFTPIYDENGEVIYEEPNVVKQRHDPLPFVTNYLDDILITSELKETFEETIAEHFLNVEAAVDRLAFHNCKINISKCEFAKSKILFLGWYITRDYIIADPRRIEKVRDFKFPENKKSMRAFLGLVNSLRRVLNLSVIEQVAILTPLTSSKTKFSTTPAQLEAFEKIKSLLVSQPLFANLINEKAEKYLFCDAATKSGVMGAVLLQRIQGNTEKIVPTCLDLDNEVHRIIYDKELPYEPVKLYTSLPITLPSPTKDKTRPPDILPEEKLLGFTPENVHDSFFWSTVSILALYNCHILESIKDYRKLAVKKLRSGVLNLKIKDFTFNLNYKDYQEYINAFLEGKVGMDPELYLAESMAQALYRPIIFISTLEKHKNKPIFSYNKDSDKPPLIYGIYKREGYEIFLPFFFNKHTEFKLDSLKNKVQIIAYVSKTVPETFKSRPILDLEAFGILTALYSLQRFISGVKLTLLTDSRVLFYLFSSRVHNSSVKIKRWCLKLLSDYPLVTLHFVRTSDNLADFLTREGLPEGDLERFNLKGIEIPDFHDKLPQQSFTLTEWINFVEFNPHYLTINDKEHLPSNPTVMAITKGLENIKSITTPIAILKEKLSREELIKAQRAEFREIINKCIKGENFTYKVEKEERGEPISFKLENGLLTAEENPNDFKIILPQKLIGPMLAYIHLSGHKGLSRMLVELDIYFFKNKYTITRNFIKCCYSCFLTSTANKHTYRGVYPAPQRAFEEISLDLAENIGQVKGYQNLLIIMCNFSNFILIYPMRSKKNSEVAKILRDNVLQIFNIRKIRSDNGPVFRSIEWLEQMSALGIEIINSSSLNPSSNGGIERAVQTVKVLYKKLLATRPTYNWDYLNLMVSKIYNTSINPQNGFKPAELVFGQGEQSSSCLDLESMATPHHLVKNKKTHIEVMTKDIKTMTEQAKEKLEKLRERTAERLNRNGINKGIKQYDYVFIKDRSEIPGAPRPLRTKLDASPYVVLSVKYTTVLVRRISDGFTSLYSMDDVKKFDATSPLFADLPKEITEILLNDFKDLLSEDFTKIMKYDELRIPTGAPITDKLLKRPVGVDNLEEDSDTEYNNEIEREQLREDINNIILEKPVEKLKEDESNESESEEENIEEDNNWEGRLRPRKKKVTFKTSM